MNKGYGKELITILLIIALFSTTGLGKKELPPSLELERRGENLIRFHVLANSDTPEDQILKNKVRDKIIEAVGPYLAGVQDVAETREILYTYLKEIEAVAEKEIVANGKDYQVRAYLGEHEFPTRRYGDVVFPAGRYEALRVVIGEGIGQNWWCVMFPPLCFVDVKHGLTDEKTRQELKRVLTEEEYNLVYTAVNEQELPLQLRSKIVDWVRASRQQMVKLASLF